jgi:hypothetical protein
MVPYMPLLAVALVTAFAFQDGQERKKIPDDSIELTVIGCLKGRVLTTTEKRQTDVESGPYVGERRFRLAGKKDVIKEVEKHDRHLVEIVGIVKRSALDDRGMSAGPVTFNGGAPAAGRGIPNPADNTPVMDVSSVRMRLSSCSADPVVR